MLLISLKRQANLRVTEKQTQNYPVFDISKLLNMFTYGE